MKEKKEKRGKKAGGGGGEERKEKDRSAYDLWQIPTIHIKS